MGRRLIEKHHTLISKSNLDKAGLADKPAQPFGFADEVLVAVAGKFELFDHRIDVAFFEHDLFHGDKSNAARLGQFDEILPAFGSVLGFPADGWNLFAHVSAKTAQAMPGDKGNHVVLHAVQVIASNDRHINSPSSYDCTR